MRILHLADNDEWAAAVESGDYRRSTRGVSLADEGFIHASTVAQVPGVLARYYGDVDLGEYTLLVVDVDTAGSAGTVLRWETPPGATSAFPHLYGPIPVAAVVATLPIGRGADGAAVLPDLTGLDVVTDSDTAGPKHADPDAR